ncbi:HNH endonuclease [Glycomyces paridis]|nr:HNH endonuclease [Glycomyces paridis]
MCKPHYRKDYYLRNKERENARFKAYREANLDREKARFAAYAEKRWGAERAALAQAKADRIVATEKACTKCGERKPKDQFHKDPRRLDGRYSWCKPCFHEQVASIRTPESEALRRQAAYADPERRERLLEGHRKWSKANPEKNREYARAYQARKREATVEEVDYGLIIERDGMHCYLCRSDIADLDVLHFDHVVPLSRGGAHSMGNIKPTHGTCNQRKHNKLLSELDWYQP